MCFLGLCFFKNIGGFDGSSMFIFGNSDSITAYNSATFARLNTVSNNGYTSHPNVGIDHQQSTY